VLERFELAALSHGALMNVAAQNELGSRGRELLQDEVTPAQRPFVGCTPGR
jgi:hypothetical protein